jgi:hypothetical protein
MRTIFAFILTVLISGFSSLFSQTDSVKYTPDFKFVDGIYRTFEEFERNDPSIKEKLITSNEPILLHPIKEIFSNPINNTVTIEIIEYKDNLGNIHILKRKEVWGYCSNGVIYVKFNSNFHRILKIGSIIFFIELRYTSPRLFPDPFISNPSHYTIKSYEYSYMIDCKTGKILKYNLKNFLALLFDDKDLYKKFMTIPSDRKRKKQMFNYLNKFNERNPVYFKLTSNKKF